MAGGMNKRGSWGSMKRRAAGTESSVAPAHAGPALARPTLLRRRPAQPARRVAPRRRRLGGARDHAAVAGRGGVGCCGAVVGLDPHHKGPVTWPLTLSIHSAPMLATPMVYFGSIPSGGGRAQTLMNLLPGLRDLRAPLAAGYLWLAVIWLLAAERCISTRRGVGTTRRHL